MNEVINNQDEVKFIKHSRLGIASFIISIIVILMEFAGIGYATYLQIIYKGALDPKSLEAVITGLFIILGIFLNIIGLALGIIGAFQKDTKKIYSIFAIVLNTCIPLFVIILIVIGLLAKV